MSTVEGLERYTATTGAHHGDRSRFVAFAFCRSDAIFELNPGKRIVFAAGATRHLFGRAPAALDGRPVAELILPEDRAVLDGLLDGMLDGTRPRPMIVRAHTHDGKEAPLSFTGYHLPDLEGHFFVSFKVPSGTGRLAGSAEDDALPRDLEKFATTVADILSSERVEDRDARLSLIEFEDFGELMQRLDPVIRERLELAIGANLRANSLQGTAAADLGEGRYGLLHRPDLDVEGLHTHLEAQVREADPKGVGATVRKAGMSLEDAVVEGDDTAKALITTIRRFSRRDRGGVTLEDLSKGLPSLVKEVEQDLLEVRRVIESGAFSMAFQPICDLESGEIHHYEVLARIDGKEGSPFAFIQAAEEMGLIKDFDRAMCRKVVRWLNERNSEGNAFSVAVNLSALSVEDEGFMISLDILLEKNHHLREQIMFELTESARIEDPRAANTALQRLRGVGHKVCLDDFGVGESSLQDLRQFQVDLVKIDGSYVRDALENSVNYHILRAVAQLCTDLGIATVAEMVEEESVREFLVECGVRFGQGYLLGRPTPGGPTFSPTISPTLSVGANP